MPTPTGRSSPASGSKFGGIDILINNAGVDIMLYVPGGDESIVREVFDVNFFSTVAGTLFVLPEMVQRGSGIIVNTSSDTARAARTGAGRVRRLQGGHFSLQRVDRP